MEGHPGRLVSPDERILVTGGRGFIGRHLLRRLVKAGADVTAVRHRCGEDEADEAEVTWETGDLADLEFVKSLFARSRPEIVFHLAGHVSGSRSKEIILPTFRSNLASTVHLLKLSADSDVRRIILAGSLEEPDPTGSRPVPCSPYAASKWAASAYGRMFHRLYGLSVVVARIFMVYGPGRQNFDRLVPYTIRHCLDGTAPVIESGGRPVDWIYVSDVVEGLLRMAEHRDLGGETIDLGTGDTTQIRDVVTRIVEMCSADVTPDFQETGGRVGERVDRADPEQSERLLGWSPEVPLGEGLERTIEWFRDQALRDG